jgi:hypothetical protein
MSKLRVGSVTRQYYLDNYSNWYGGDTEYAEKSINEIKMNFSDFLTRSQRVAISVEMRYLGEYYACQGNLLCFKDAYQGWKEIKRGFFIIIGLIEFHFNTMMNLLLTICKMKMMNQFIKLIFLI